MIMSDSKKFKKAVELIGKSNSVLITTHIRPDGDACGCIRAMMEAIETLGRKAQALFMSPLPSWYKAMFERNIPVLGNDIKKEQLADYYADVDLVIIVDTNSNVQLPDFGQWLKESGKKTLVIDHHISGDGLGDVELVDSEAAAAAEVVFDLFKFAGWAITPRIAEALFIALSMDTGWFKYSNADSRIFHTAAELIEAGARPDVIYRRMHQSFTPARLKLMTRMLEHLELHSDGRIATQYILRRDFDETGSCGPDTENLIDECQRIRTVEAAALFVELADGGFRCSLRSKGRVDVREIAQKYGGGGHTLAAGVNLDGPLEKAKENIVSQIRLQLNG